MERIDPLHLSPEPVRRPCALVVDDDAVGRLALRKMLSDCGYDTVVAKNGAEGVERFSADRPDIVFMDMLMPVMDGIEATARIKKLSEGNFVPVVFVTGSSDEEDLVRCIEAGGDDFLVKPYNKAILAARILSMKRIGVLHRRAAAFKSLIQEDALHGRDAGFAGSVCESLEYAGAGERTRAIYAWRRGMERKQ